MGPMIHQKLGLMEPSSQREDSAVGTSGSLMGFEVAREKEEKVNSHLVTAYVAYVRRYTAARSYNIDDVLLSLLIFTAYLYILLL